jgi:hypothetical protein
LKTEDPFEGQNKKEPIPVILPEADESGKLKAEK